MVAPFRPPRIDCHTFAGAEVYYEDLASFVGEALREGLAVAEEDHPRIKAHLYDLERGPCPSCLNTIDDLEKKQWGTEGLISAQIQRNRTEARGS